MEGMVIDPTFWRGRSVFLTGHTGFKGAWMSLLLGRLGVEVHGFALAPESEIDLFVTAEVSREVHGKIGDVRDAQALEDALRASDAEIAIHMAAQSLVRRSYAEVLETYATNVMGTAHLLEAARRVPSVRAVLIVTSDKCYENLAVPHDYRETDGLGGHDPYSASKACAEIVTGSYRRSFFQAADKAVIASVRAGNVIGGGDWARDRLLPDAMRAFAAGELLRVRNPNAIRPWQHVFDPVLAYLRIIERLFTRGHAFAEAWNIGPSPEYQMPVSIIADRVAQLWGGSADWVADQGEHPHEAQFLNLDCSKAATRLGWRPLFSLEAALQLTVAWYRTAHGGANIRESSLAQIDRLLQMNATENDVAAVL
ncbi:MAG: CDP-glucose 4,6-dehydratase [Deltaproteobacteria bacterium]|nr:CDP-glucose 4,6-dehydratase [Deltaproteobacteria bacterium]